MHGIQRKPKSKRYMMKERGRERKEGSEEEGRGGSLKTNEKVIIREWVNEQESKRQRTGKGMMRKGVTSKERERKEVH